MSLRRKGLTPYLLLLPGLVWLALFFLVPLGFLGYQSLESGSFDTGYTFSWAFSNYWDAISSYHEQFVRSRSRSPTRSSTGSRFGRDGGRTSSSFSSSHRSS
jgi:spermidine/putrescine transport system permease protein